MRHLNIQIIEKFRLSNDSCVFRHPRFLQSVLNICINKVAHENVLYIYGGVLGNSFFHEIYSFDLDTKNWSLISISPSQLQPSGRSFLSASVQNDCMYVFGGNGDQNARSNEIYRFKLPRSNQPRSTLKNDFYKLLQEQLFCDLRLVCHNNHSVYSHCAMLAARSVYCRQLIKAAKEQRAKQLLVPFYIPEDEYVEIRVDTENSNAVQIVLEFLYTDRIISLESKETELDTLHLMIDVYKVAYKFMLPKLKKICENLIDLSLTCRNVLALLRYIHSLSLPPLKEFCMKFLAKDVNFNQVIMFTEFEQLETQLMVEIIRLRQNAAAKSDLNPSGEQHTCTSLEQDMESFIGTEIGKVDVD